MKSVVFIYFVVALGIACADVVGIERSDVVGPSGSIHREQPVHLEAAHVVDEALLEEHPPATKIVYRTSQYAAPHAYPYAHPYAYRYPYPQAYAYNYPYQHAYAYNYPLPQAYAYNYPYPAATLSYAYPQTIQRVYYTAPYIATTEKTEKEEKAE